MDRQLLGELVEKLPANKPEVSKQHFPWGSLFNHAVSHSIRRGS
jgi:hypothetical protein